MYGETRVIAVLTEDCRARQITRCDWIMKEQMTVSDRRERSVGRLVGALGIMLALILAVGVVVPAYAQTDMPPAIPCYFDGTVSTSSGLVPEGTVVQAFRDGVYVDETTVSADSTYVLVLSGEYGDQDKIVSFTVAGVQASQTALWKTGENYEDFNLTISALPDGNGFPFPLPCFVATAAYGIDTTEEINLLREFRDVVLLPSGSGAEFVCLYYEVSPAIAGVISRHEFLKTAVRAGFVDPVVAILNWSHALWSETD